MIKKGAEEVNNVMSLSVIQAINADIVNWDLAEENQTLPFVNYKLNVLERVSKDGVFQYAVDILVFGNSLTESAEITDKIFNAIESSDHPWRFRTADSGYNYPDGREALTTINFEFKL